jgi:hypothetical protein
MFTRVEYLRLTAALPIIAPIPLFVAGVVLSMLGVKLPEWVYFAINISFGAVFMFGIPYCMLVCVLLFIVWEHSWKTHIVAALTAPILMIPVVGGFLWMVEGKNPVASAFEYAPYCLGVGYAYVGIALLGLWLIIRTDRLKNEVPVTV